MAVEEGGDVALSSTINTLMVHVAHEREGAAEVTVKSALSR